MPYLTETVIAIVAFVLGGLAAFVWRQRQQLETARQLAAAEEKNSRIPELESVLETTKREHSELNARNASLETQIAEERKAAGEKLALIEDARAKLADAFSALSAEALRNNSQSFLELANANLEKFQQVAQGDLEKRQQAIHELVKPVRESLDKVDAKIADLEKVRADAYGSLSTQVRSL